jgi:hypothetical protein
VEKVDSETEEAAEAGRAAVEVVPAKDVAVQEALKPKPPIVVSIDAATSLNSKKRKKKKRTDEMEISSCPRASARGHRARTKAHWRTTGWRPRRRRLRTIAFRYLLHSTPHNCDVSPIALLTYDPKSLIAIAPPDVGVMVPPKPPRVSSPGPWIPSVGQPPTTSARPMYSLPILILTGLPLPPHEGPEGSPRKKRRCKRKKNKSTGEQVTERDPPSDVAVPSDSFFTTDGVNLRRYMQSRIHH